MKRNKPNKNAYPQMSVRQMSHEQTLRLIQWTKAQQATLNDVIMRNLLLLLKLSARRIQHVLSAETYLLAELLRFYIPRLLKSVNLSPRWPGYRKHRRLFAVSYQ